jgi:predicted GNAT superfamily acetyltransferase
MNLEIRNAVEADFPHIVALNAAEVQQTSAMDLARLTHLAALSSYHKVALLDGEVIAFLLAMREGLDYDSENYRWFATRFPTFLYVDRIVVDARAAGRGVGRALYEDLFAFARAQNLGHVTCEYNIEPPNPASKAFHDRFGFEQIDTQWVAGGSKRVSLQAARL